MAEPNGAETWFPVNDHPRDKATYRFEITVPEPWVVTASGSLQKTEDLGDHTRFTWEMDNPMASYLASINIDRYTLEETDLPGGLILRNYFPASFRETDKKLLNALPEMISYFSSLFGPYPFKEYGIVIAAKDITPCTSNIGGALETQSLSVYCPKLGLLDESILAHELAHQWFGDSVSLKNWQDLWMKEGMATYAEWLWTTRNEGSSHLDTMVKGEMQRFIIPSEIGSPPVDDLYGYPAYKGGALVYHALRVQVGNDAFFKILKTYNERYRYGNASAADFIALSEEISGQDLSAFFDSWLNGKKMPEIFPP
jgi:aminopeptidase N